MMIRRKVYIVASLNYFGGTPEPIEYDMRVYTSHKKAQQDFDDREKFGLSVRMHIMEIS